MYYMRAKYPIEGRAASATMKEALADGIDAGKRRLSPQQGTERELDKTAPIGATALPRDL